VAEGEHVSGYRTYWVTWFWLLVITVLEVAIVLVRVPRTLLAISLLTLALMKAALIMAYFMHLKYERLSLVYTVVVPMIALAVVLFGFVGPDALSVQHLRGR
jgi:cytochrome c oxidase subunit 4